MKDKFEISLLESGELMKRGAKVLVANVGRVVAVITVIVSALALFTDISFQNFKTESFTSTLLIMLAASYIMYFSMSDAGEALGEETEEYKASIKKCEELSGKISGDMLGPLRDFCKQYSEDELLYRREGYLISFGYSIEDYNAYKAGKPYEKKTRRIFKKAEKIRAVFLTPQSLLSKGRFSTKSELQSPEGRKRVKMLLKLIPTTLCMTVTVSVILTTKEGLTASGVIDGIFKLASLPIIGFKGYASGYNYTKKTIPLWLDAKARLIEAFIKSGSGI